MRFIPSVTKGTLAAAFVANMLLQTSALAQSAVQLVSTQQAEVEVYWTPQRLVRARPIALSPASEGVVAQIAAPRIEGVVQGEGAAPTAALVPYDARTLIPEPYLNDASYGEAPGLITSPNATSTFGAFFTTGRVFPDTAVNTYPYLTAGKLFFRDQRTGADYVCSASVLRHRIVVTAGHCLAQPSTNPSQRYFYSNFLFVPALRNGVGPVGAWTASLVAVTNDWYLSNGSVPNPQDVGMLVMRDQAGVRIGSRTGFLGYRTNSLAQNNVTMLGYPCNLDSCQRMEINNAQTHSAGGSNTYRYGSAMRGGSSGGPWIQDFGISPASNPAVALGANYLVGVTSYGPVSTTPKYQGASNLDSRFLSLLSLVCGAAARNCTP